MVKLIFWLLQAPDVEKEIYEALYAQRTVGNVINSVTAQHIMIGILEARRPNLLKKNGGRYGLSRPTVRRFLRKKMGWTFRYRHKFCELGLLIVYSSATTCALYPSRTLGTYSHFFESARCCASDLSTVEFCAGVRHAQHRSYQRTMIVWWTR
jgi:hypothetical protein